MTDLLVNKPVERKLIASYLDHQFIISVIFKAKIKNIIWSQLLKCQECLCFLTQESG